MPAAESPHPPGRRLPLVHMQGGAWSSVAQARGRLAGLPSAMACTRFGSWEQGRQPALHS